MVTKKSKFPSRRSEKSKIIKSNPKRKWSIYQKEIFKDIAEGTGNIAVIARAGAAKTSSIIEGFKYIPKGKKTLMVAFNKSIAEELKQRAPSYVDVMTLHSLGFRAIKQNFGNDVVLDNNKCFSIVKDLLENFDVELIQNICKCISLCKGFLVDAPSKINDLMDRFDIETFDLSRELFISYVIKALGKCKSSNKIIDFDDMIWFPFVYRLNVGKYDVVCLDEAQDVNVAQMAMIISARKINGRIIVIGDPHQCVDENTLVNINDRLIPIKHCEIGQHILCYNNSILSKKVITNKTKSAWDFGYEITTKSGNKLLMSPNHKIWASAPDIYNKYIVYLMYRQDMGFRIGSTNSWKNDSAPFDSRVLSESADKIWVLDVVNSNDDALLLQQTYSIQYAIPTCVFEGKNTKINQDIINKIFNKFGQNGHSLLNYKYLSFNYPHYIADSKISANKIIIKVNAHSRKGTQVSLNWNNDNLDKLFIREKINFTKDKISRIIKCFVTYKSALEFATILAKLTKGEIHERISILNENPYLLTASSLHVGMKVYSLGNESFIEDSIINIEKKSGIFYDIEVESAGNFIGNNILSHNSIYQFRGADSESIPTFIEKLNAKTLSLPITYRCPIKIVKLAKEIVPDIEACENAEEGLIEDISISDMLKTVKPGDFILSRTNAPLIKYCMALLKSGVPANIQGRDVGANLQYFIKKSKAKTIDKFIHYVNEWRELETKRLLSEKKDTSSTIDKCECLLNLCEGVVTIKDLKSTIDKLFNDVDDDHKVILSTTHKVKGMERDRVFLLTDTYRYGPGVTGEEANIYYVAITRAKKELYMVRKYKGYNKWSNIKDANEMYPVSRDNSEDPLDFNN
jgi:superfamily I DNA/RNA helicase